MHVVVVGQTPPPHHGQAIMIEEMLAHSYEGAELHHVRMSFSGHMTEVGRFSFGKLLHLGQVIAKIWAARIRHGGDVLYYPPGGPALVPVARDIVILIATRFLFRHCVFHFHAGNLSTLYDRLPSVGKLLFRLAYFSPSVAIYVSNYAPADGTFLKAHDNVVVCNGIPDQFGTVARTRPRDARPRILYAGMLSHAKGTEVLLRACGMLAAAGHDFELVLVGLPSSHDYAATLRALAEELGIADRVAFRGHRDGAAKWQEFADADLFCVPSFAPSETFGVAAVEAMMFELPVVASRWRGLQETVADKITGFLFEPRSAEDLARNLAAFLADPELREAYGRRGRARYLQLFTLERYVDGMQRVFDDLSDRPRAAETSVSM